MKFTFTALVQFLSLTEEIYQVASIVAIESQNHSTSVTTHSTTAPPMQWRRVVDITLFEPLKRCAKILGQMSDHMSVYQLSHGWPNTFRITSEIDATHVKLQSTTTLENDPMRIEFFARENQ